jgi:hypothetical protein
MPKLRCLCGFVHDLGPIPDAGWITIRDIDYEQVIDAHIRQHDICGHGLPGNDHPRVDEWDRAMRFIIGSSGRLYECPECGRLAWQKPDEGVYTFYQKGAS